jgi:hypothetical protein
MPYQVQKLSHRHEQVVNWLVTNPDRTLRDCAEFFGFTPTWISQLVGSDMFQAAYQRRCEEVGQLATHTLVGRLGGLANLAIEKAADRLSDEEAPPTERFIGETLRTTLGALGYTANGNGGNGSGGNGVALHLHLTSKELDEARERAARLNEGRTPAKVPDGGSGEGRSNASDLSSFIDVQAEGLPS